MNTYDFFTGFMVSAAMFRIMDGNIAVAIIDLILAIVIYNAKPEGG